MPGADPVAVIGMGAVGTVLAGALAAAGHPILACGRAPLATKIRSAPHESQPQSPHGVRKPDIGSE